MFPPSTLFVSYIVPVKESGEKKKMYIVQMTSISIISYSISQIMWRYSETKKEESCQLKKIPVYRLLGSHQCATGNLPLTYRAHRSQFIYCSPEVT